MMDGMTKANLIWREWGARLRAHARVHKIKWGPLIREFGVTPGGFRHWLNGTRSPKVEDFFRMCEYAKADPRFILFGELTVDKAIEVLRAPDPHVSEKTEGELNMDRRIERRARLGAPPVTDWTDKQMDEMVRRLEERMSKPQKKHA